jgi:hypothetical protein
MNPFRLLRRLKHFIVARSAAVLFEACTNEFYDCESLSDDKYAELRRKVARQSNSSLVLIHLKNIGGG